MTLATADVCDVDAFLQALNEAWHERQGDVDQGGVEDPSAGFGHQRLESRELGVGDSAALAEGIHDLVLDEAHQGRELRHARHVVEATSPRDERGMLGRKTVGLVRGVVFDDLAGHHGAEPLADVPLVEARCTGDLLARGWRQFGDLVEKLGAVADAR